MLMSQLGGKGVDPFVPKIMSALKSGLQFAGSPTKAACDACHSFVRHMSDTKLKQYFRTIVVSLLRVALDEAADDQLDADQRVAVRTLHFLIVEKRELLQSEFEKLPMLALSTSISPALQPIHDSLNAGGVLTMPLATQLAQLTDILEHEGSDVRFMGLTQLVKLLEKETKTVYDLALQADPAAPEIETLMHMLLRLARMESEKKNRLCCAKALGALGAIDPARMRLQMKPDPHSANARTQDGTSEMSEETLAFCVIIQHLVPMLRAAKGSSDSIGFALQVINISCPPFFTMIS